ncbi:MAG: MazG nucleotide pyrophosphohydrolase domain-containing protein [Thermincolia bacterium]
MIYNFPKHKVVDTGNILDQLKHFATECREIAERIENDDFTGIVLETIDMLHSGETFLRMAEANHKVNVNEAITLVVKKNNERG